jgi:hypothetical protein
MLATARHLLQLCLVSAVCGVVFGRGAAARTATRRLLTEPDDRGGWAASASFDESGSSGASQLYITVHKGSCSDVGLYPLPAVEACKTASSALGFHEEKQPSMVSELFKASVPFGCSVFRYPGASTGEGQLVVNPYHDSTAGCGAVGGAFTCLCSSYPTPEDTNTGGNPTPDTPPQQPGTAAYVAVRTGSCDSVGLQVSIC